MHVKRIIFIVCFLLISLITPGCGPEALPSPTVTPTATVTPIPPTETLIPPLPTASPEPEMFQIRPNGVVQEYQGGQYVDILVPNNVWGKTPEGVRVVIKDNWPVLEMDLNNFQDPNGAKSINIAKYNPDTKSWTLLPFSMTREVLDKVMLYELNNRLDKRDIIGNIDSFSSSVGILGVKVDGDSSDGMNLDIMVSYRNQAKVIRANEIWASARSGDEIFTGAFDPSQLEVGLVMEILHAANHNKIVDSDGSSIITLNTNFVVLPRGVTESECVTDPLYWQTTSRFTNWCKDELQKGNTRKILTKADVDWLLLNGQNPFFIDMSSGTEQLMDLWDSLQVVDLEGVFIQIGLNAQN